MSELVDAYLEAWDELTAPGERFAMSESLVHGSLMRTFDAAPSTMRDLWEATARYGDRDYLVYEDERFTYSEAHAIVRALAATLQSSFGVRPGDRIALALRNYPEWVFAYWATVSVGAICVGMNAWWTSEELRYGIEDSAPKVLIADSERVERVLSIESELTQPPVIIGVRVAPTVPERVERWEEVVHPDRTSDSLPSIAIDSADDACIFYTSGTTGLPKGARLTHRGSIHNVLHIAFMSSVAAMAEAKLASPNLERPASPREQSVFMAPTPLFHVTALNCLLHPATMSGARIVFTYKWDPRRALELIERERVTTFSGVPTMSRELLAHPDWSTRDTSSLRGMGGGGAPAPPDLVGKIQRSLSSGGGPSTGYGLTETHGIVTANSGMLFVAKPTSCGRVVPTLDAKLVDEAGAEVPPGEPGELCVRGPVVFQGYLNQPEATAEAIVDGWFHTGDIARIDGDGFVEIVDRIKDVVLRGGENVYCAEVEAAIYAHEAVAEVAVFASPDERLGELVTAAIVLNPAQRLTSDELRTFLADRLAAYKIPERVVWRDEPLPRNASGKFLKRELKAALVPSERAEET